VKIKYEIELENFFVFSDDVTAYIIPHKKIVGDNGSQFINKLTDTFQKAVG